MYLRWHVYSDYSEIGGRDVLREAIQEALTLIPPEHLRRLDAIEVHDRDPKRKSLGLWRHDGTGITIELYAEPHVQDLWTLDSDAGGFALRLHLAYTLFHEVGHHVTRVLNRRAAPPRKAPVVEEKMERWADEYAEKRIRRLCERWLGPGGRADTPDARRALETALHALRLDALPAHILR